MAEKSEKSRISIGLSLPQRKVESIYIPSLVNQLEHHGIDLILVDLLQPPLQQPRLDYLVHKPYHQDWKLHLLDFQSTHPNVRIIDPISAIDRVSDRESMLSFITGITLPPSKSETPTTTTTQNGPTEVGSKSDTPTTILYHRIDVVLKLDIPTTTTTQYSPIEVGSKSIKPTTTQNGPIELESKSDTPTTIQYNRIGVGLNLDIPTTTTTQYNPIELGSKSDTPATTTTQYGSKSETPTFGIPSQMLLLQETEDSKLSLQFPVIAKPLLADYHLLSLVFNSTGLQKVKEQAPIVLQEFVNHGGVMFKVYVAGRHIKCVHRSSLPDFHISNYPVDKLQEGIFPFTRVSNTSNLPTGSSEETVRLPPLDFVKNLASAVREATQLHLFNLDLIRDANDSNRYLIIDINYFPGFDKFPRFEDMLTDFFLDVVQKHETIYQT